ncbi:hypothetical protein T07_14549, partial [Trichinella nelsoni]
MDVKAFPSRPSVPLLITNSIITSLAELFATSFRSGQRSQSCSHQFVLDVASQTSVIGYVKCAHFIHDSITLTRSEFDLVPFATRVRMDVKAFPSRPSVPLLITNSIFLSLWTPCLVMFTSVCSKCGITNILAADATLKLFPMVLSFFLSRKIRNHVDKYVITKHYYQLMPLCLATIKCFQDLSLVLDSESFRVKGNMAKLRPRLCLRQNSENFEFFKI